MRPPCFAATASFSEDTEDRLPAYARVRYDADLAEVRRGLDRQTFEDAWQRGRSHDLAGALSLALGERGPD